MIRKTLPYCKHTNDMMLFTARMDWLVKQKRSWGHADPHCANNMIRKTVPCCKRKDDMNREKTGEGGRGRGWESERGLGPRQTK